MGHAKAYDEIIDFIASGTTSESVIHFRPSPELQARVADLIAREKREGLAPDETAELDSYMHLEHIMRLAKARARRFQGRK